MKMNKEEVHSYGGGKFCADPACFCDEDPKLQHKDKDWMVSIRLDRLKKLCAKAGYSFRNSKGGVILRKQKGRA